MKDRISALVKIFANEILANRFEVATVLVGPVVWGDDDKYYFVISTSNTTKGFFSASFNCGESADFADRIRSNLIGEMTLRKPIVICSFDDELDLVRCCETTWPCEKTRALLKLVEEEHEGWRLNDPNSERN